MKNPWSELPKTVPFVLPGDEGMIDVFNGKRPEADKGRIHLTPIPEPFLGRPDAKLVLLNLNPRYNPENLGFYGWRCPLVKAARLNLIHAALPYPFWTLHPGFRYYGGYNLVGTEVEVSDRCMRQRLCRRDLRRRAKYTVCGVFPISLFWVCEVSPGCIAKVQFSFGS